MVLALRFVLYDINIVTLAHSGIYFSFLCLAWSGLFLCPHCRPFSVSGAFQALVNSILGRLLWGVFFYLGLYIVSSTLLHEFK